MVVLVPLSFHDGALACLQGRAMPATIMVGKYFGEQVSQQ